MSQVPLPEKVCRHSRPIVTGKQWSDSVDAQESRGMGASARGGPTARIRRRGSDGLECKHYLFAGEIENGHGRLTGRKKSTHKQQRVERDWRSMLRSLDPLSLIHEWTPG
jgi:hypothetical protein